MARRVRMSRAGARAVLNAPGVEAELLRRAEAIAASGNQAASAPQGLDEYGFNARSSSGGTRARAYISTGGFTSRRHNAKFNTLVKSIGAGRGG